LRLEISKSGTYKNKICPNSAKQKSYFVLVKRNEISAIILQHKLLFVLFLH